MKVLLIVFVVVFAVKAQEPINSKGACRIAKGIIRRANKFFQLNLEGPSKCKDVSLLDIQGVFVNLINQLDGLDISTKKQKRKFNRILKKINVTLSRISATLSTTSTGATTEESSTVSETTESLTTQSTTLDDSSSSTTVEVTESTTFDSTTVGGTETSTAESSTVSSGRCPNIINLQDTIDMVNIHNEKRALFNDGFSVQGESAFLNFPAASPDLPTMSWDSNLALQAQEHSDLCKFQHSSQSSRKNVHGYNNLGENLYTYESSSTCETCSFPSWTNAVESWFDEYKFYPNNSVICSEMNSFSSGSIGGEAVGHFTQVIAESSTKIGCGMSACGCAMIVTCLYGEAGNFLNQPVYSYDPSSSVCTN